MTSILPGLMPASGQQPYFWGELGPFFNPPPQELPCCAIHGERLDLRNRTAAVAVHEAGHAVAAFVLGVHVPSITLTFTELDQTCGQVTQVTGANNDLLFEHTKRTVLTVLAAGVAANAWLLRESGLATPDRMFFAECGGRGDWMFAKSVVRENTSEELDPRDYWRYWAIADELLAEHRVAVAQVAELVIAGPVSGDEAATSCGLVNSPPIQRPTV
ncbi:hypothetical protein ACFVU3_39720 [Streptomyces sp. NPDC058052]|uniref:hypothetical protein n=1 Tax=Streptomyces sp. NPDC058052 TaxID=3346316 RepID=UPI0036E80B70